jgi:hypothetical protein
MELVKNIFFNTDKLIENTTVKISYTGKLFQEDSSEVFVHYGFGPNWDNVTEKQMEKTELGFQAEIELNTSESLNLCFRNSNNEWDNNNSQNYTFEVEKAEELALVVKEDTSIETPRKLRKTYLWSKKIRLAVYKIITYLPKIISGNYKRKVNNDSNE